ncbi:MAG: hypothetical protein RR553_05510 [Akkermansia sp.]
MIADTIISLAFMDHLPPGFYYESLMIILGLILIEGLLSVDNALGIAAMASHLPKHQQKPALRWGIIGAYLFRGIALATVAWLMHNMWIKWFGAFYLVYLAANHLSPKYEAHPDNPSTAKLAGKSLLMTIASIELMDLSLSIDNVVAAVGMVNGAIHIPEMYHIWVVCIGVFIGILALRVVAGWCIGIIAKYPILNYTAFLLVGFVGLLLMIDMGLDSLKEHGYIEHAWKGGIAFKFTVISFIVAMSIIYSRSGRLRRILRIPVLVFRRFCLIFASIVHAIFWPISAPVKAIFHKNK